MWISFIRLLAVRVTVITALALLSTGEAAFADTNNSGTVNCGDASTKGACIECCTTLTCIGQISCCPLVGTCTITNKLSAALPTIKLNETAGGLKLQFQRKGDDTGVDISLKATFLKKIFPKGVALQAHIVGPDAPLVALLYPVAFFAYGSGADTVLGGLGFSYTATVDGMPPDCQSMFPAQLCTDMANGFGKSIEGAIKVGSRAELDAFLNGVYYVGYPTCPVIF